MRVSTLSANIWRNLVEAHGGVERRALLPWPAASWSGFEKMHRIVNLSNPIIWITIANLLYLVSYSVRDILWLRVLTVAAALLLVPYYAFQPSPLMTAIEWNAVFIVINLYWITRLIIERRPVHLTQDAARLRSLSFPSLTPREARNLFAMGIWVDLAPGASLVQHDIRTNRFSVILRGIADVVHSGTKIAEFGEGQFVGVIDVRAEQIDVDVIVRQEVRIFCWSRSRLQSFIANRPDVALALERSVGHEIQRLLDTALSRLHASSSL
jgi:hypothetical protein